MIKFCRRARSRKWSFRCWANPRSRSCAPISATGTGCAKAHGLSDEEEVDQILAEVKGSHLLEQVDGQLVPLLGMRYSRLSWDQKDLYAKDSHPETHTPRHVRIQR